MSAPPLPTPSPSPDTPFPPSALDKDWFNNHNYLVGLVTKASHQPLDIYFLGDSITEFWTAKGLGKPVWDSEYGKYHVLNNGVRGDTTQNILWRISKWRIRQNPPEGHR